MVERGLRVSSWKEARPKYRFEVRTAAAPKPHREEESRVTYRQDNRILYTALKRFIDIVLAGAALILLSPVLLLITALIRLDTPGPALIRQQRIGRYGKPFTFYKFRSMTCRDRTHDAREFAKQYLNGSVKNGNNGIFKPPAEIREITRVGGILRKFSLDEFPQLINVLKGDMSLVGPRPNMYYELEYYSDWHKQRLVVLPGLTGLAQVRGRSHLQFDDIVRLDVEYIEHRSLAQDLKIILMTLPALLGGEGAG